MGSTEKQEACQLFIEQEIETGLAEGKTPYRIGKELVPWLEKLFEAKINSTTIEKRAERARIDLPTNVGKESKTQQIQPVESLTNSGGKREGAGRPPRFTVDEPAHRTSFTGDNEWYTPVEYIEAARDVMGTIDLDPATSEFGQIRVQAKKYYTQETPSGGLYKGWYGNVWLNPPYSQPDIWHFVAELVSEYGLGHIKQAILLTHNYTDTKWFHHAESVAALICFTKGRVKFEKMDGATCSPAQGSAFFYFGENTDKFREVFGGFGFVR